MSSNPKWGFAFTGSVFAFRRPIAWNSADLCTWGYRFKGIDAYPQKYPTKPWLLVEVAGRRWTKQQLINVRPELDGLDVGGRLRTSLDGSPGPDSKSTAST